MTEIPTRDKARAPGPVAISVQIYKWLQAAYPAEFQAEYGFHMAQLFRDTCRREYSRQGLQGMALLWARTTFDLLRSALEEHIERGMEMTRESFVRWSGWALMAGGILFAAGLILGSFDSDWNDPIGGVDAFYEISQIAGMVLGQGLFVVGLLGLRAGYASRSGGFGAAALLAALVGSLVSMAGIFLMNSSDLGWGMWLAGLLIMTLSLAGYGVAAMRHRVFVRWNFSPLLAGVILPFAFVGGLLLEGSNVAFDTWLFPLAVASMAIGLVLIGFRMQAEAGSVSQVLP